MDTMNIALPPQMKDFVQAQVEGGGYSSVSEYVRQLIRADQQRKAGEEIDRKLLEALDGGHAALWTPAELEQLKSRVRQRHSKRRGAS
jgi:antitoxin ParD1/3/4